jgi:two-component system, chemotaxis family, CheB/CheR fusion protein
MVVVDKEMRVVVWNRGSEELWGLRYGETAGHLLAGLDIGLPMDDVKSLIGQAFVDSQTTGQAVVDAVNRRGKPTKVRVSCSAFWNTDGNVDGALRLMETQDDDAREGPHPSLSR